MEEEAKANKRICGRHNKEYEFICTNSECKGRLLCGECILEHDTHKTKLITEYMNSEQEEIKNSLGFPNEENLSSKFQIMNSKSAITAKLILKMRGEMEASYKHLLLSIQKEIEEQMNRKIGEIDVILGNIDQYHEICSQSTTIQQEITFITSQISCKNYDLLSSSIVNLQLLKSLLHSNIINANFDLDINWDQIWKKEMHKMVNSKEVLIDGKAIKKIQIEVEKEFKMASSFSEMKKETKSGMKKETKSGMKKETNQQRKLRIKEEKELVERTEKKRLVLQRVKIMHQKQYLGNRM